jgi:hypothetical protein
VRENGTDLEIRETDNTPEIVEDRNLRYGRRVETRDALSGYGIDRRITITPHEKKKFETKGEKMGK